MIEYRIYKCIYGWKAESQVELGNDRVLSITTMKRSSGALVTTASVGKREGMFISHMMFQDFNTSVETSTPKKVTQKAVETQHIGTVVEDLVAKAIAFYA